MRLGIGWLKNNRMSKIKSHLTKVIVAKIYKQLSCFYFGRNLTGPSAASSFTTSTWSPSTRGTSTAASPDPGPFTCRLTSRTFATTCRTTISSVGPSPSTKPSSKTSMDFRTSFMVIFCPNFALYLTEDLAMCFFCSRWTIDFERILLVLGNSMARGRYFFVTMKDPVELQWVLVSIKKAPGRYSNPGPLDWSFHRISDHLA